MPLLGPDLDNVPESSLPLPHASAIPIASRSDEQADGAALTECCKDLRHHSVSGSVTPWDDASTPPARTASAAPPATGPVAVSETTKSHGHPPSKNPQKEADGLPATVSRTRHILRHGGVTAGPALARDRQVLRVIVDCKYLSAAQIQEHLFHSSITPIRRCLQRLEAEGWIALWEPWTPIGGRTKYAIPQRKALTWALGRAKAEAAGTSVEALSRTLIPTTRRRPIRFKARTIPPFFLHQVRTNDVVLALRGASDMRVVWATAWDRPLPKKIGTFATPQPDAVLVIEREGFPLLLFIETDRATQKMADFKSGKSRYAGLGLHPAILRESFGMTAFHTLVIVQCDTEDETRRRIELLLRTARAGGFASSLTFASFDWVLRNPDAVLAGLLSRG
jgi:protein involved in plasmid replication-relaxation